MSNHAHKPRVFAWHVGQRGLALLGAAARERAANRREAEAAAAEIGERVSRPYVPGRAEREGRKSKVWPS